MQRTEILHEKSAPFKTAGGKIADTHQVDSTIVKHPTRIQSIIDRVGIRVQKDDTDMALRKDRISNLENKTSELEMERDLVTATPMSPNNRRKRRNIEIEEAPSSQTTKNVKKKKKTRAGAATTLAGDDGHHRERYSR
jgi:hypothetical protein